MMADFGGRLGLAEDGTMCNKKSDRDGMNGLPLSLLPRPRPRPRASLRKSQAPIILR